MNEILNTNNAKLFIRFLKLNGICEKYFSLTTLEDFERVIKNNTMSDYLQSGDRNWWWDETEDGAMFWLEQHCKWVLFLIEHSPTVSIAEIKESLIGFADDIEELENEELVNELAEKYLF